MLRKEALQRKMKSTVFHQEGVCRVKETKAICTAVCCLLQVPALGVNRKRFSRQVKNEHNSEREDEYTQPVTVLWSYLAECWHLRVPEVGEHGCTGGSEECCRRTAAPGACCIPSPGRESRPGDGSLEPREWPGGAGVAILAPWM